MTDSSSGSATHRDSGDTTCIWGRERGRGGEREREREGERERGGEREGGREREKRIISK